MDLSLHVEASSVCEGVKDKIAVTKGKRVDHRAIKGLTSGGRSIMEAGAAV